MLLAASLLAKTPVAPAALSVTVSLAKILPTSAAPDVLIVAAVVPSYTLLLAEMPVTVRVSGVMFAVTVDWDSLLQTAYVSAAFGIGILLVAGVAVLASMMAQDRQQAHQGGVVALQALRGVCVLAIVAAVAFGIYILTNK